MSVIVTEIDYDARGQRLRCVHGNGTTASYAYEPDTFRLSRMRLVRASDDAVLQDLRYTYDPVGNIVEIRDGAQPRVYFDNDVVSADQRFEYDALYRLSAASGRELRSLSQPVDAEVAFSPQPHADDPAALRRYEETYAWDAVGNIVELRHTAAGGSFTRRYAYAAGGNRLLRNSAPGEAAEPFSHSYSYDAHGNMTSMPHLAAMAWDHADRLQHCDLGGGGEVWFVYDASGARVRKVQRNASGSRVRERVYLGEFELYRERAANDVAPEMERQTLHVGDGARRLCLVETLTVDDGEPVAAPVSVSRFQHGNHLDSASLELDGDAAVISYEELHPFGTTSYAANDGAVEVSAKRYRYIGKERDEETGLYHLGARYYASWLGRWTAADPTGLADGVNRYAYCRGNPITLRDPDGSSSRPSMAEVSSYEAAAERHNTEVGTWHAEVATFDGAARNAGHTARRLEQQRVSLLSREHALSKTWADLVVRTADADISEFRARESKRQLEFGGPDPWTLSGRTMNRLGGVAKLSGGVSGTLASGGLGAVMGADFIQAGVRQLVSGEESDTVMRGGTALLSEGAFGQSARTAGVHGDIAETLAPVSLGAWQLGRLAGAAAPTRVAATRAAIAPPAAEAGGGPRTLYHYTDAPEQSFQGGLWSHSSVTDDPTLTAQEAVEQLGVKRPPDKIIPVLDQGHFVPNKPHIVEPHPLGSGGGKDFMNPRKVPPEDILPAQRVREN